MRSGYYANNATGRKCLIEAMRYYKESKWHNSRFDMVLERSAIMAPYGIKCVALHFPKKYRGRVA